MPRPRRSLPALSLYCALYCSLCCALATACSPPNDPTGSGEGGGDSTGAATSDGGFPGTAGDHTESGSDAGAETSPSATSGGSAGDQSTTSDGADDDDTGDTGDTGDIDETGDTGDAFEFGPGVFVHGAEGVNSNPGTMDAPLRTIQAGIALAAAEALPTVYVAEGTYEATHEDGESVEIVGGVDVLGGFSAAAWEDRDPSAYETRIVDLSQSEAGTSELGPHRAVYAGEGVDAPTRVEGFTIVAAPSGFAAAVATEFSAQLHLVDDTVLGNADAETSYAVHIRGNAQPTIEDCLVDALGAQGSAYSLWCANSEPTVVGNDIVAATDVGPGGGSTPVVYDSCSGVLARNLIRDEANSPSHSSAIWLGHFAAPAILANTIVKAAGNTSATAAHIRIGNEGPTRIENNNFIQVGIASTAWCIYASDETPDPGTIRNNNFGCSALYRRYTIDGPEAIGTIVALQAAVAGAVDNVDGPPGVVDAEGGDYHLAGDGTAPCEVVTGGQDLSAEAGAFDLDGTPRTAPWSIGAYEYDGACF